LARIKSDLLDGRAVSDPHGSEVSSEWASDEKNSGFAKVFQHHIIDRPFRSHFKVPTSDLTDLKTTHMFHSQYYNPSLLVGNSGNRKINIDDFFNRFSESPITTDTEQGNQLGPNKIVAIIGRVGTGKSTFISHLMVKYFSRIRKENVFAIRVDVEEFAGRDVEKGKFFRSFFQKIQSEIYSNYQADARFWNEQFTSILPAKESEDDELLASQYILACKSLFFELRKKYGQRGMVFLDNLDKYYYLFDRASFSLEGEKARNDGVKKLASILCEFEAPSGRLNGSGLCVLVALRKDTLDYLVASNHVSPFHPLDIDAAAGSSIFRLKPNTANQVIDSRVRLLKKCIEIDLQKAEAQEALEQIKIIEKEWKSISDPTVTNPKTTRRNMLSDLSRFMHHGHRSLVDHLSKYKWAMTNTITFHRIFRSYSPAILLFMLANYQRYSQVECRFPNLFLVRSDINSNLETLLPERLKQPHKHTYWLKYLILKYIYTRNLKKQPVSKEDVMSVFCRGNEEEGYYEDHIVELVLGSLCQVDGSFCIDPVYGKNLSGDGLAITNIFLTDRGRFLMERFAFDFTYLQLLVEDYMLELPAFGELEMFREQFNLPEDLNYEYLLKRHDDYSLSSSIMVTEKLKQVALLLEVLRASYGEEGVRRKPVFDLLKERGVEFPNFTEINKDITRSANAVLDRLSVANKKEVVQDAFEFASLYTDRLKRFFHTAYTIEDV
jgi:hypothetical protein